ncbi:MAG: rRNA maturation RNase YbeY [Cytophagaceae bacterium]|nr:rRNA maturation RNase YbeY [Cytophagaceae bacterium]|tara:strand:- start:22724 stop:23131 length:408 start_codon:yes stop_codon:yes gene_type:complete
MIEFNSQNDFKLPNEAIIDEWLNAVASSEGFKIDELGYVFCSDDFLWDINQKYLDHDTLTDIITFDYGFDDVISGEIYISTDRVSENANDFNVAFADELKRVLVHGILHLCGYKDKTPDEAKLMRAKEDEYIGLR